MKYIELTQNKKAMVDDEDFEWLNSFKWYYHCAKRKTGRKTGYAMRDVSLGFDKNHKRLWKHIYMHREINKTPEDMLTDHQDGNGLNNQRFNLRTATRSLNGFNRGRDNNNASSDIYKGVYWHKQISRWYSRIAFNGKDKYLGTFDTARDAAKAYNLAALEYHGEFARLNNV